MYIFIEAKQPYYFFFLFLFILLFQVAQVNSDSNYKECPKDKPVLKKSGECVMEYCTKEQYDNLDCNITNPVIQKQFLNQYLYITEKSLPISTSIGTNDLGDIFFESSSGYPLSTKKIFTLENDGREYIDGVKINNINSGNDLFSKNGNGAVVTINDHKCYLKLSSNESIEMFDFDIKKYTYTTIKDKLGEIKSEKNSLLRTKVANTFIYAYITSDNYLMMTKFKVVSNDANDCIQIVKTLKEDIKSIPTNTRSCMITVNQYIECIDIDENQMYVIRIYDSDLKFLKQYELEKNNAPLERAYYTYHEVVWLKKEISIFVYYNNTKENNAKPILVLKQLTVNSGTATLNNLNNYLIRDTVFKDMVYKFSDTENSLAIFNEYYFGIVSLAIDKITNEQHLIVALANIFNSDKTIDTHYFDIPLTGLYDINYQSNLRAFGYKNAFGVQMNYIHENTPSSGFIVFGYGNTTDPKPINNLFDKYTSYTIKVKDYYQGTDNNIFCYVFVNLVITEVPSSTYFTVKTGKNQVLKKNSKISLDDEIIITKVSGKTPPKGRYVLGIAPYLNEADYQGFTDCSVDRDMFGYQTSTNWYPDEFYGRTIEFQFTVNIDCFENCLSCDEKGIDIDNQKCTECKNGYFFIENTNNCFGEIPEGYYFNETKKTYIECYDTCKACSKKKEGNNHNCKVCKDDYIFAQNSNCINCKKENKYFNYEKTECIDIIPEGYYINDTTYNTIDKCYEKCKTCEEGSIDENNMKCLSCDNDKGMYLLEGKNNCVSEIKEGEYLDSDNIIKKCNIACKTCSSKEILNEFGEVTNCDSCNSDEGYNIKEGTNICTNKNSEKSSQIINIIIHSLSIPCHPNCLTCEEIDLNLNDNEEVVDMHCKTCDNTKGYYMLEGTNNCVKLPYPGYYLQDNTLKKCYKNCASCSQGPISNANGKITNMNCDTCNELEGLYLIQGTNNCQINEDIYSDICPEDKPISKNGKCVLQSCTKEEYDNKICNISNPIIKTQWINNVYNFGLYEQPIYSTLGQINNEYILFESNIGMPYSARNFIILDENARGYYDGTPNKVINLNSSLFSTYANAVLLKKNDSKIFIKLSNYETMEVFDLNEDKYTFARLEDKLGYKVESSKNSLLKTNEENTFIYAYITIGNHLIMTKFKVVSNDANDCLQIIKTNLEDFITIPKNSRRCLITVNQYIECIDIDENQMYVIRIYDSDLNFLKQYELEKNNAPLERAYYTYHEAIWLKDEIGIFVYYNDISDHNAKPNIILKKLKSEKNGNVTLKRLEEITTVNSDLEINLINISTFYGSEVLFSSLPYILSDSENSLAKINSHYFALATLASYENNHLLIAIMNNYNDDNSILVNYFDVPLKDLYDINYYGNIKSFGYKDLFGIQFDHKINNKYSSGFIIFGFANSTDPEPVENLFNKYDNYTLTPSDYIKIENNVLCYKLTNVIISEIPDVSSGIVVRRNNEEKTILKKGDILSINEEIVVTYIDEKSDIEKGNYKISFTPYLTQPEYDDFYQCSTDEENFGEIIPQIWDSDEIYGKTFNFEFTVGYCYPSCASCKRIGSGIMDQECDECIDKFYFIENTKNCFSPNYPPNGYYFDENEEKFKKCYENCKTCKTIGTSEYDMKCTSCDNDKGYFMLSGTKNCRKMPIPGYYIDKETNKIKKCDISCATCSYSPIKNEKNEVTNCDTCNKDLGFYNLPGETTCVNTTKIGEYYDENCKCYKKCHTNCLTCSGEALDEYHMNCLSCDSSKGFEFYPLNSNCLNCESINKKINAEQTECIDEIDENVLETNITEKIETLKTMIICHENCVKCSGPPTYENDIEKQNCITCQSGFYLNNGNCIKSYTCPYKYFYQAKIDKNADATQKICLEKDESCPCALPFYYPNSNECVESCPLDMIFYRGCEISDVSYGLNNIISLVKLYFQQGLVNSLSKSFVLSDINELAEDILIQITIKKLEKLLDDYLTSNERLLDSYLRTLQNLDNYTINNITDDLIKSDIDLGQCEKKLRDLYNISEEIELIIMKLEIKKLESKTSEIQYEIYNPCNRSEKLNLSVCKTEKVKLINEIDSSVNYRSLSSAIESKTKGKSIFDEDSDFYNDYCFIFNSDNGADVLIQDRYNDFNYEEMLCQSGCDLDDINITSNTVSCLCPINDGFDSINILKQQESNQEEKINIENSYNINNNDKYIKKKYSNTNFKALKCIMNISSNYSKNSILIILTVLLLIHLGLGGICIKFRIYVMKKLTNNTHNKKDNIKDTKQKSDENKLNEEKEKDKTKNKNKTNSKKNITEPRKPISEKYHKINDKDYDSMGYLQALEKEKRSYIQIFFSLLKRNEYFISSFCTLNKTIIFKLLRLNFVLINLIVINTLFISEKNIHQIYIDNNIYNFCYQFKYIILSFLILFISLFVHYFIYSFRAFCKKKGKIFDIILLIISSCLFLLSWIYVGSVTSLYINAKRHLLINISICFLFGFLFEIILTLIATTFRHYGLNGKKPNERLYEISRNTFFNLGNL